MATFPLTHCLAGTIEEKILELQKYKTQVMSSIIRESGGGELGRKGWGLGRADLQFLLRPG